MPDRLVICNTSPLLYLHQVSCLELLAKLYGQVIVPPAVERELRVGRERGVNAPAVSEMEWIVIQAPAARSVLPAVVDLGPGEAEVLALGLESPGSLLVLDDQLARRIAKVNRLSLTGTFGVLIRAKEKGLLKEVRPTLERLRQTTMRISDGLFRWALQEANEPYDEI